MFLCLKASRQLNALIRIQNHLNIKQRNTIYETFVLANFNFCPIVWNYCSSKNNIKLERIQKRALRFLLNDKTSSYAELIEKSGRPTLSLSRIRQVATEVYKSLNGLNPVYMSNLFKRKELPYNLRQDNILILPKFKSQRYGRKSFTYNGSHIWNLLPQHIKSANNVRAFKTLIKQWSCTNCTCNMCIVNTNC